MVHFRCCFVIFQVLFCIFPVFGHAQAEGGDAKMEAFVDSLIGEMTIKEKAGQLVQIAGGRSITPNSKINGQLEDRIRNGEISSIINVFGAKETARLQKIAVEESRMKIPVLFAMDVIHGFRTIFPVPLANACTWDPEMVEMAARTAAEEATSAGLHWTFAPMVDITRDPRWGRIVEGAGEDPYLGAVMADAGVRGFQGESLFKSSTLMACPKHFAGYGAAVGGRDYDSAEIPYRTLREIYFPPFLAAVNAGAGSIMSAFQDLDAIPMTANRFMLINILRDEWDFGGFVVSDWNAIYELINHGVAEDVEQAGKRAIQSGVDMDMISGIYGKYIENLVYQGLIYEEQVDQAVRRILTAKYKLGLFDNPYQYCDQKREKNELLTEENIQFARLIAQKGMVLLKNENGILPLSKNLKRIAVIGPLADDRVSMLGSWSCAGREEDVVTVLSGIRQAASSKTKVIYEMGCQVDDASLSNFNKAVKTARTADVVILVLGEKGWMSGEGYSRSTLDLPGDQEKLALEIAETGKPVVAVLMNGRPLSIGKLNDRIPAILEAWFPGIQAGRAVADILFGDANPAGRLTVTFPHTVGQVPMYYNHRNRGRPAADNVNHSAKYQDAPIRPLYAFGYGLSYSQFAYSNLHIIPEKPMNEEKIIIKMDVQNTSQVDGEEVVQLYIQDPVAGVARPVKMLKGFCRVPLKAGKVKTVEFGLPVSQLAYYEPGMMHGVEPGEFRVMIGGSSEDIRLQGQFEFTGQPKLVDPATYDFTDVRIFLK